MAKKAAFTVKTIFSGAIKTGSFFEKLTHS
jgi:hypothetical protein